mmetsp:Transcript_17649/g.38676  ORF Transcript_17649/g.38676 Transcript_17649/m.38676 type:complete len:86 (+) Transcript_17649:132-389(+)
MFVPVPHRDELSRKKDSLEISGGKRKRAGAPASGDVLGALKSFKDRLQSSKLPAAAAEAEEKHRKDEAERHAPLLASAAAAESSA